MKLRILIPTDFSASSKAALEFAYAFGRKLHAELFLLHVLPTDQPPMGLMGIPPSFTEDIRSKEAQKELNRLAGELQFRRRDKLAIATHIEHQFPLETAVEQFAEKHRIDLIIVGTKGASGIARNLFGSNATAIISHSSYPVIAVPLQAVYKPFKHIVYATDLLEIESEVQTLMPLVKWFQARLHVLHIVPTTFTGPIFPGKWQKKLIKLTDYPKIKCFVTENDQVNQGIDDYLAVYGADLLAMFTHRLSFWEKRFGRSVTREEAFHTGVPILTFKKEKLWDH